MSNPTPAPPRDASPTRRGFVNTLAQAWSGVKSFLDPFVVAKRPTVGLPPANGLEGALVYDTDAKSLKVSDGTAWTDLGGTPTAAEVSVTPVGNLTSTNVQAALQELQGDVDTNAGELVNHTHPYSPLGHDHNDLYFTEAEANSRFQPLGNYATLSHSHDNRYYTEAEADARFALGNHNHNGSYAPLVHTHSWSNISATPTTLEGYGISDAQPLDGDLTVIAGLTGTGLARRTGLNTWVLDSTDYQPAGEYELLANKNVANGYAGLDATGKISGSQLPTYVQSVDGRSGVVTLTDLYAPLAHVGTGDTAHAAATQAVAGFMSAGDKLKLDSVANGATNLALSSTAPATVGTTNIVGAGTTAARADHVHSHGNQAGGALHALATAGAHGFMSLTDKSKLDGLNGALYELLSNKNQVNGYAGLDASGKLNTAQLPAIAITDTFVVATQAAMLALTAEIGDVVVRTDLSKSFILKTAGASTLANWQELLTPTDAVLSVDGRTGIVTLSDLYAPIAHVGATGAAHGVATQATAGFMSATDKAKLDGIANSATSLALSTTAPASVGTANSVGTGSTAARSDHVHAHGAQTDGTLHAVATQSAAGFLSVADKTKLDGVATNANNYVHPTGDGNLHVPATGTTNNNRVLKAGATAGSLSWGQVAYSELTGVPATFPSSAHNHPWSEINGQPTTLAGYGITDALTSTASDARYLRKDVASTGVGKVTLDVGAAAFAVSAGAADQVYMEWYARTAAPTTRSGYLGFASTGITTFTLSSEIGHIQLKANTIANGTIFLDAGSTGNITLNRPLVGTSASLSGALTGTSATFSGTVQLNSAVPQIELRDTDVTGVGGWLSQNNWDTTFRSQGSAKVVFDSDQNTTTEQFQVFHGAVATRPNLIVGSAASGAGITPDPRVGIGVSAGTTPNAPLHVAVTRPDGVSLELAGALSLTGGAGIIFPDGSTQATASYTKTESEGRYQPIGSYQALDADLTAIAALTNPASTAFLKKSNTGVWSLDTTTYQTSNNELTALAALVDTAGFLKKTGDGAYSIDTGTYLTTAAAASGYQPLDADLTSIAALAGTTGLLRKTAANTWSLDTNTYATTTNVNAIAFWQAGPDPTEIFYNAPVAIGKNNAATGFLLDVDGSIQSITAQTINSATRFQAQFGTLTPLTINGGTSTEKWPGFGFNVKRVSTTAWSRISAGAAAVLEMDASGDGRFNFWVAPANGITTGDDPAFVLAAQIQPTGMSLGGGQPIKASHAGSYTLTFGAMSAGTNSVQTVSLPGVQAGDVCVVSVRGNIGNTVVSGYVNTADQVNIKVAAIGAITLNAGAFDVRTFRM